MVSVGFVLLCLQVGINRPFALVEDSDLFLIFVLACRSPGPTLLPVRARFAGGGCSNATTAMLLSASSSGRM